MNRVYMDWSTCYYYGINIGILRFIDFDVRKTYG